MVTTPTSATASLGTHAQDGFRAGNQLRTPYNIDPYASYYQSYGASAPGIDLSSIYMGLVVPQALNATNIATAQTLANAGTFTLAAGTNTSAITLNGIAYINLTTSAIAKASGVAMLAAPSRCITFTTSANSTQFTATIRGLDNYGVQQAEEIVVQANATAATTTSLCAYSAILSVTSSAGTTANVSIGTSDTFGLNYAVYNQDNFVNYWWNSATFGGTFTAGSLGTNGALTATSGDPKGTLNTAANSGAASNGTIRLVYYLAQSGLYKPMAAQNTINYVGLKPFYE